MTKRRWRNVILLLLTVAAGFYIVRPIVHLVYTASSDSFTIEPTSSGHADDVSRMSAAPVREIWKVPAKTDEAEAQLVALLRQARALGLPVAIAGARHSMGGHTIAPEGIIIDMLRFRAMNLSADGEVLTVQAGALWSDIIPYLNSRGRSVAIMQSNNSFTVGGSLSANVHGWQSRRAPIASTVRSFRLLTADGQILRCSRSENADLFSLALGGYGLFGIILEAELWTVPNRWYSIDRYIIPAGEYASTFRQHVEQDSLVEMSYGRVSVAPESFMDEAVLTVFRRMAPGDEPLPDLEGSAFESIGRTIFRGSVGSDYGKQLRWWLERNVGESVLRNKVSRNQVLDGSVDVYMNRREEWTEILHEYFLPPENLSAFFDSVRHIVPLHDADLLNVTLRDVRRDPDSFLRYANQDVIAVVMLFSQSREPLADSAMATLTRRLIDAAAALDGTYYLPYRPHATLAQFTRAYPQAPAFFSHKKKFDSAMLFRNRFYLKYGAPLVVE